MEVKLQKLRHPRCAFFFDISGADFTGSRRKAVSWINNQLGSSCSCSVKGQGGKELEGRKMAREKDS